jgi:hypothetical protein
MAQSAGKGFISITSKIGSFNVAVGRVLGIIRLRLFYCPGDSYGILALVVLIYFKSS